MILNMDSKGGWDCPCDQFAMVLPDTGNYSKSQNYKITWKRMPKRIIFLHAFFCIKIRLLGLNMFLCAHWKHYINLQYSQVQNTLIRTVQYCLLYNNLLFLAQCQGFLTSSLTFLKKQRKFICSILFLKGGGSNYHSLPQCFFLYNLKIIVCIREGISTILDFILTF